MAKATIKRFDIHFETDVSHHTGPGPSTRVVTPSASAAAHHRVLPYFKRQRTARKFKLSLDCQHSTGAHASYVAAHPHLPEPAWAIEFDLAAGTSRNHASYQSRELAVSSVAQKVTTQIDCRFWVVKRWNSIEQDWMTFPGDEKQVAECALTFEVTP